VIDHRHAGAAASLALHLTVIAALFWPAATERPAEPGGERIEVSLMKEDDRLRRSGDAMADTSPDRLADGPRSATALSKCDGRIYTGIGLRAALNGTILEVASGGPADKAGIRAGDVLLNGEAVEPDQYEAGTPITLRYLREEREMPPVVAVIDEVCNEQPRPRVRERRLMV